MQAIVVLAGLLLVVLAVISMKSRAPRIEDDQIHDTSAGFDDDGRYMSAANAQSFNPMFGTGGASLTDPNRGIIGPSPDDIATANAADDDDDG